ncbi:MAG: transposase [Moorea sp. SIO2I5]|nr:transposase [Moorena sp. SIO2I5]
MFGCGITTGTIANLTMVLAEKIQPVVEQLAGRIKASPVKHLDETGFRIAGQTQWLHVVSTESETRERPSRFRKNLEAKEQLLGVVVHDHCSPYYQLEGVKHGLCNAHHLRELKANEEIEKESIASAHDLAFVFGL